MELAFLGTGMMGRPMAENLLADGDTVRVWNRTAEKAKPLVAKGATLAESPAEACEGVEVVVSCLANDEALRSLFEDGSVLRALAAPAAPADAAVHVSMSTISERCAEDLARGHGEAGVAYAAAPILGRPDSVAARQQAYLLAGEARGKKVARPILERLGKGVFDLGERPGAANVAKIELNFLIAAALEAMAEAFAVVEKAGLDPAGFHEMITGTLFGCPLYQGYGKRIVEKDWDEPGFKLALGQKDVGLAATTAKDHGARARLVELLGDRFREAVEHGRGEMDWTAIAAEAREDAGLGA